MRNIALFKGTGGCIYALSSSNSAEFWTPTSIVSTIDAIYNTPYITLPPGKYYISFGASWPGSNTGNATSQYYYEGSWHTLGVGGSNTWNRYVIQEYTISTPTVIGFQGRRTGSSYYLSLEIIIASYN